MSLTPGYHKIQTVAGMYLTLLTQNGTLTAQPASGAPNQLWDFQRFGIYWTIRNTGYSSPSHAYSTGQQAAPVTGNASATEWAIIPHDGIYSIQLGTNSSNAWTVDSKHHVSLSVSQLKNPTQQFSIE